MIEWRLHRVWLGLVIGALALLVLANPVIDWMRKKTLRDAAQTDAALTQTTHDLTQLRDDIATTQKLQNQIDAAEVAKRLAPIDRLRAVSLIERCAAQARLQHVQTTLSPETKVTIETLGAGPQILASSHLVFQADAATDLDFYHFIDALRQHLPGHVTLRHMVMERITDGDTSISATNLRVTLEADWLSNGSNLQKDKGAP